MEDDHASGVRIPTHPRVLIVEDDSDCRLLLSRTLQSKYTVAVATSGLAALQSALRHPPDLFILDVVLPGMDGYELAERIRARRTLEDIPILFLTAKYSAEDAMRALALGVRHYMTKPFNIGELSAKVDRLVGVRRTARDGRSTLTALNR